MLKSLLRALLAGSLACAALMQTADAQSTLTIASQVLAYFAEPDSLERLVCLIGEHYAQQTVVTGFALADADSAMTTGNRIVQLRSCAEQGIKGVVGIMHSHPTGEGCFYYFPTTSFGTSDLVSALRSPYAVDVIYCRGRIVWLDKEPTEHVAS